MNQVQKFLLKLYRGVGTTRAASLEKLVLASQWSDLQRVRMYQPQAYPSANAYLRDALIVEITRKLLLPGDTTSRKQNAIKTFWASEAQCAETNIRLNRYINNGPFEASDMRVMSFIDSWRKELKRVLGSLPSVLDPVFSGGSTLSDAGQLTTIPDKMSSHRTIYARCLDIHQHSVKNTVLDDLYRQPQVVDANRFFTVPKDSEKDRGCCVEASGAIFLQLAVGRLLKKRYQRAYGVNLLHAQDLHRSLAQKASVTGRYATIDLSNASDTVSRELIRLVLPPDWYELLNSLRAHHTEIDGKRVYLEKFSSMGNGFTFELETIIFRSMCATLGTPLFYTAVFGDDIIVPGHFSSDVMACLQFFGFTPNPTKTFCKGPFRESCGGDYFNGTPVRAHYLKEIPDEPQHWVALANGLRRANPDMDYVRAAWRYCIDQLPLDWRVFGPSSLGDTCIHDPDAQPTSRLYTHKDACGTKTTTRIPMFKTKVPVSKSFELTKYWVPDVALATAILKCGEYITPRNSIDGYKTAWVPAWGVDEFVHWHRVGV